MAKSLKRCSWSYVSDEMSGRAGLAVAPQADSAWHREPVSA
jgi:hypothetical protein